MLDSIAIDNIDDVIFHLSGSFKQVMCNKYGNYFMQKLLQCCTAEQRVLIIKNVKDYFVHISCHPIGTHSMQTLVELVNSPNEENEVLEAIKNEILYLSIVIFIFNSSGIKWNVHYSETANFN